MKLKLEKFEFLPDNNVCVYVSRTDWLETADVTDKDDTRSMSGLSRRELKQPGILRYSSMITIFTVDNLRDIGDDDDSSA